MQLNTRSRYAINAMVELAMHENYGPISVAELSRKQGVSISYLELLFSKLRKSGLVESMRGPGGGYSLGLQGASVSIADIVTEVDGVAPLAPPPDPVEAGQTMPDMTQGIGEGLHATALAYLQSISLSSLARQYQRQETPTDLHTKAMRRNMKPLPNQKNKRALNVPNPGFVLGQVWSKPDSL
ncbi:MAG: Rrf2 family transcriptional regulator [Candidatus Saccharibacteria bacterium]|nr:Rrf2 family transcriptional regulator [Rhodoferax sp.]